jgi:hypothetical protein
MKKNYEVETNVQQKGTRCDEFASELKQFKQR